MRDVRLLQEGGPVGLARRYVHGAADRDFTLADFTCNTCGAAAWGPKEPLHCVKCGGIHFTPRPTLAEGPLAFANSIGRMSQEAQRLLALAHHGGVSVRCRRMIEGADRKLRLALAEFYAAWHGKAMEWKEGGK